MHFHILLSKQEFANFRESQKNHSSVETLLPTTKQTQCSIHVAYVRISSSSAAFHGPDIWYNEKQEKRQAPLCILGVKKKKLK